MADKYFGDYAGQRKAQQPISQAAGNTRSTVNYFNSEVEIEQICKKAGREAWIDSVSGKNDETLLE